MNITKISNNGQITIPLEVRNMLGLKFGDKIIFTQNQNGEVVVTNASAQALRKVQKAFVGAAEILGVKDDDDIQKLVDEVRYEK